MTFYNSFFGFPNNYWHPYYKKTNLHNFQNSTNANNNYFYNYKKTSSDSFNESEEVNNSCNYENNFFNFLGLNLQPDDILILALLFFLYKEDCDDIYLYIALLLLLLS